MRGSTPGERSPQSRRSPSYLARLRAWEKGEGCAVTDEILVLKLIAERLDSAGIPYMVSGSVAMSFYANPRMTRDVDIVVELRPADVPRLKALFDADFALDEDEAKDAIARRSLFNVIHQELVI